MILIGLKTENTGVGTFDTDYSIVSNQRMDIIAFSPSDTSETLAQLYHAMVKKGERSKEKLIEIQEELEFSDMSEEEYERKTTELLADIKILKYERVLIVDGIILK
jgi:Ser-tRNA(Ala) deacylase AlaX